MHSVYRLENLKTKRTFGTPQRTTHDYIKVHLTSGVFNPRPINWFSAARPES